MVRNLYSALGKAGGLLAADPNLPYIRAYHPEAEELLKKYEGEKAEVEVMQIILKFMKGREGAIINGHKTGVSLVDRKFREELMHQNVAEDEIEEKLLKKMLECFEVKPNEIAQMEKDAEDKVKQYFGSIGEKDLTEIERTIQTQKARRDGNKWKRMERKRDMKTLDEVVSEARKASIIKKDPKKAFFEAFMKKKLDEYEREHDIMITSGPNIRD